MEPRGSKCQRLDARDNEEGKGLDKFESEGEGENIGYVSFPLLLRPKKSQTAQQI